MIRKIIFTLFCCHIGFLGFTQNNLSFGKSFAYQQFNIAKPYINYPFELVKSNDSTFTAFLSTGSCPGLSIRNIVNGTLQPNQIDLGARYSNFKLKSRNGKWLAVFQLQYIDDVGGSEEVFIREKEGAIITSATSFEELLLRDLTYYHDFTFLTDTTLLCLPSFKKHVGGSLTEFNKIFYITNLDGKILDSISNPIDDLIKIDKIDGGYICATVDKVYNLNENFEIIQELATSNVERIIVMKNSFCILRKDKTASLFASNTFEKKVDLVSVDDLFTENDTIYFFANNVIHKLKSESLDHEIVLIPDHDPTASLKQLAVTQKYILLAGEDTHGYKVSEFRAFSELGSASILNDISITAWMDSFHVDTFMIHVFGNQVIIEYDNDAYFSYEVTNNGSENIANGIVHSPVFGGINCSLGYHEKEFFDLPPGQSQIFSGSINIRSGLSYQLCLFIPSSDDKPDANPEDNKTCFLLSATKDQIKNNYNYTISPNPATNEIYIQSNDIIKMEIFDIHGKCVMKTNSNSAEISDLASGLYFARIQDIYGRTLSQKLIKI